MANASPNAPVVTRYARALLQLANANKQADPSRDELKALREILKANPTFKALLSDPGVSTATRDSLIKKTFTGRSSPTLVNFLGLLNFKGRIRLLALGEVDRDAALAEVVAQERGPDTPTGGIGHRRE